MVDATADAVAFPLATSFRILLVVVVAGSVGEKVVRPARQLRSKQYRQGIDRCIFSKLGQITGRQMGIELLASRRYPSHVSLQVPIARMV